MVIQTANQLKAMFQTLTTPGVKLTKNPVQVSIDKNKPVREVKNCVILAYQQIFGKASAISESNP